MTTQSYPIDALIREMLERRASVARPDGLLPEIVRTAAVTPQSRRRFGWSSWTNGPLATIAAAAMVVAALVGALVVAPRFDGPGTSQTPGQSQLPMIQAAGVDTPTLPAGRYQTDGYEPRLVFTVPDRLWAPMADMPRELSLRAHMPGIAAFEFDVLTLVTIENVYLDPCTRGAAELEAWDPSLGPGGFLDWFETVSNTDLGPRAPVRLLESDGLEVEFLAPDLTYCARGYLPISDTGLDFPFKAEEPGALVRYSVITLQGRTVVVGTFTTDDARRDAIWPAADAVLESIEIAP